jgi:hypothetical protein
VTIREREREAVSKQASKPEQFVHYSSDFEKERERRRGEREIFGISLNEFSVDSEHRRVRSSDRSNPSSYSFSTEKAELPDTKADEIQTHFFSS